MYKADLMDTDVWLLVLPPGIVICSESKLGESPPCPHHVYAHVGLALSMNRLRHIASASA